MNKDQPSKTPTGKNVLISKPRLKKKPGIPLSEWKRNY